METINRPSSLPVSDQEAIARQSWIGVWVYLMIWLLIGLPNQLASLAPGYFFLNGFLLGTLALVRAITLYRFEQRYHRNPARSFALLAFSIYISGFHWGCVVAYSMMRPELHHLDVFFIASLAAISGVGLTFFPSSVRFGVGYYAVTLAPAIAMGFWLQTLEAVLVALFCIAYLLGSYSVGRKISQRHEQIKAITDIALQQAQAMSQISFTDGLTGIKNRHYFDMQYAKEWHRATRAQTHLALLLLDIDHFKQVNDTFGHLAGDQCLRAVSQCLQNHCRRNEDFVARFGGEEFVLVLPSTELDGARLVAEKILQDIRNLTVDYEGQSIRMSASIGLCCEVPPSTSHPISMLEMADKALYVAKGEGRDTYRMARSEPQTHGLADYAH